MYHVHVTPMQTLTPQPRDVTTVPFSQGHLGCWMSMRLPECSSCSPGRPSVYNHPHCHYIVSNSTRWCFAHMYDPEVPSYT